MKETLNEIEQRVANNLKIIRRVRGFTLKQVGDVVGVTQQQIQKYESGNSRVPLDKLILMAKYLDVSLEFFVKEFKI